MSVNIGKAVAYLELDTSKFSKGFASAYNDLKVFGDKSATADQKIKGLSSSLTTTGMLLSKNVTVPLAGVGVASIKMASDFESGMSEVKAISGATSVEFESLKEKAIEMGAKTKFSATESAEAFKYMAMAGWDASDMISGIDGIMNLAAASGEDLASVSDIVTDALTAFGLQASDSAHFADVLAQASARSNTNVGLMGDTFKYVAPVAGALGYSVEDTAVAIGLMANSGIKASQAGTALRSMLTNLTHPVGQAQDAIEELGISITNADGTMKPLSQTMEELRQKFSGMTEAEKAQYAAMLAGQEGMSGLLAIVNASETDFQTLTNEINNANGAAEDMADTMMDNTKGAVEQLRGALESAGITIGNRLTPYIRKLATWITDLVDDFNNLSEEQQDQIVKWALIAAGIGPVLAVGGKVLSLTSSLVKSGKTLATAIGTLVTNVSNYNKVLVLANAGMGDTAKNLNGLYKGVTALKTAVGGFGVVYGSVIALATAGVALTALGIKEQQKRIDKLAELTEQEKLLSDSIKEQNETYEQMQSNRAEAIDDANKEAEATQLLADKLSSVVDENGKVLAGKESYAEFIAGELSDALGQEVSIVDGQVQGYKDLMSAIDDVITKQKALAIQEATHDDYVEAIKNQTKAQSDYAEQLQVVFDAENSYNEAKKDSAKYAELYQEAMEKGLPQMGEYREKWEAATEAEAGAKKKLDEVTESLDDSANALEGYNQTVENYEGLGAAIISGSADEIEMALLKVQQGFLTANTATKESLEEQAENIRTQYDNMKTALQEGVPGVTQEMVDQIGELVTQADNELQTKINQDKENIKQSFSQIGIEAPQSLIDSLYEKEPEVQQGVLNVMTNIKNGIQLSSDEIKTLFQNLGIDAPDNFITSLASKSPEAQASVISLLTNVQNGTQLKKEQIETLFSNLGITAPDNLVSQLESKEPSVQASAISLLQQLQNAESSKRPAILKQLNDLGIKMDDNLASGIESQTGKVTSQAGTVGDKANKEVAKKVKPDVDAPKVKPITNAVAVARSARSEMQSDFNNNPLSIVANVVKRVTEAVSGHHANGLDYVPYNGYVAELHQGERVLTKQENKEYNKNRGNGSGGDTFVFYNTKPDPYEYSRQMKRAKRELQYGM